MENQNESAQVDVVEQEEETLQEEVQADPQPEEEVVTIPKAKFVKMQRKAIAYDAGDKPSRTLPTKKEIVEDFSSLKGDIATLKLSEQKRQFGYMYNLSPEETDAVFKINSKPTKEDLENPFVKGGLEALRLKKKVEDATPSPSSRSIKVNGKTFQEMDSKERSENWGDFVKARSKR